MHFNSPALNMLVVVLIIICCVLFGVWSWVSPGQSLPLMSLHLTVGVRAKLITVWSWFRPRGPSPPVYPGALPLIGHAHLLCGGPKYFWKFESKLYRFCSENGGVIMGFIGLHPVYAITDLEDSLVVANTCLDKPYLYKFAIALFSTGLGTTEPSIWKVHRKLLSPVFNQQVVNTFVRDYDAQAKILVSELACEAGKTHFDVQPYLLKNIIRNVYRATYGINSNDQDIDIYAQAIEDYMSLFIERIQKAWLHLQFIFNMSSLKKKHDDLVVIIKRITSTVINERKLKLNLDNNFGNENDPSGKINPVIDRVIDLNEKHNVNLTDDEIRDHMDTIVIAAYDSTNKALTFTLILIGSHQDVQNKMYKELQEVLGDEDRELDKHDLTKLVYLEAVIKESLRLIPTAPRIARACNSPVKLKNYTLIPNSTCIISMYHINRNPNLWGADPEQFRPERWLDPTTLPDNSNAFATFSLGKINCIGKLYAMMSMKVYLANILRRYRVTGDINRLETICDIFLNPIKGHHISLELRK